MKKNVLDLTSDVLLSLVGKPVVVTMAETNYKSKVTLAGTLEYILVEGVAVALQVKSRPQVYVIDDATQGLTIEYAE
jgi:hypothetical protein